MLRKLLFRHQDKRQLIIAIIGSFLGMTFLITSIHYLIKVNEFGEGADILGPNTIIVQKKVTSSNTLNIAKTDFSPREIELIKAESFIIDVKPVITNNFDVSLETDDPLVPRFRTDVFIQTLDKDFLDVKSKEWHWDPNDTIVPIIMPREFLVMLNTFASASGIGQVSDEVAKDIRFRFTLKSEDKKEWVTARIIGFTNSVSSILVPETFMTWANNRYAPGKENKITQIMISGQESEFGLVENMLKTRHLESKNAQMVAGRLKSMVGTLILIVLGISVIAVFLSGLVLIQYLQLLLSKNTYEVRTLLRLGFHPTLLTKHFFYYFSKVFGIIAVLSLSAFFVAKLFLDSLFEDGGIYIGRTITLTSICALILAYVIFAVASFLSARKGILQSNNG
ncbi:MAG: hypothetical protein IT221_05545 [Fluviicola sp.]|nr:hypothetical protein [Fluviicola sp.]